MDIKFFGSIAQTVGLRQTTIDIDIPVPLKEVVQRLILNYPVLTKTFYSNCSESWEKRIMIISGQKVLGIEEWILEDNVLVICTPPVGG